MVAKKMGVQVSGLALPPSPQPNLFHAANVADVMQSEVANITDLVAVQRCFAQVRPDIVIHMAAQPLVRYVYRHPLEINQTNVIGTLHVLECIRASETVRAAVLVATDKCYENREWHWSYRENDALGGHDPYSSSKACMELITESYRNSYFSGNSSVAIATVRAGNAIGGGDWVENRLLPDLVRSISIQQAITFRNPNAIRLWQHVLESLSGYLRLAEQFFLHGQAYAEAWNFEPDSDAAENVRWIVEQVVRRWPELKWAICSQPQLREAHTLKLDCSNVGDRLGWRCRWSLDEALGKTVEWYQQQMAGSDMKQFSLKQIDDYLQASDLQ